ncbi:MAG: T9SS type A sorting domain-containing protein [candidate division KSB1 bacterium]|nr:T9SS type A sorting domain-containing protein [candidate division KSB1 bacterium]
MASKIVKAFLIVLVLGNFTGLSEAGIKSKAKPKMVSRPWKIEQYTIAHLEGEPSFSKIEEQPSFDLESYLLTGTAIGATQYNRATCYMGRNIAVGSNGVIHATWTDRWARKTYYSRSTDGGQTWMPRMEVQDVLEGDRCSIAVDPSNPLNVFIAYNGRAAEGENRAVRVRKSTDGGLTWGPSVVVDAPNHNPISNDIIVDSKGNPHIVFDNNNDSHIYYNYSADGGTTWFEFPEVADIGASIVAAFGPAIAIDKNGNPHVVMGNDGGTATWGDKNIYWTWRDMSIGFWMEIPPVQLCSGGSGLGWATMVVDSKNNLHVWYDDSREMKYRKYNWSSWSEPVDIPLYNEEKGGQQGMCSAAIDAKDNLFVIYKDGSTPNGTGQAWDGWMDVFSGTNISGEWKYVNITRVDAAHWLNYCDVAREVLNDGVVHMIYTDLPSFTSGDADENPHSDGRVVYVRAYPWPPEPECSINQLPDTYYKTHSYTITAKTADIDGYVVSCSLYVWVNGQLKYSLPMTSTGPDAYEASFTWEGTVGDSVAYQSVAIDNDGYTGPSKVAYFKILEPANPNAGLLLIDDDGRIPKFYTDILDSLKYYYEVWDFDDHKGMDASVTGFGWKTIIVYGWVAESVPTRDYTGNPYAAFLQSGTAQAPTNLALLSQDYFYANGEPSGEVNFNAGDFAYDFFQISSGTNDPAQDSNDSLLIGIENDPISGSFAQEPFELNNDLFGYVINYSANPNWIDWTAPTGSGVDIFIAANQGKGAGVRYDAGTFKTVMIPWMMSMLIDTLIVGTDTTWTPKPEAYTLMQNILTWFGTEQGKPVHVQRDPGAKVPDTYALHQNYPNPFNPVTHITYDLPKGCQVELTIYNVMGQKVRTLVNHHQVAGSYKATWDGHDDSGASVASGIYFYEIKAGDFAKKHKMLFLK